MKVARGLIEYKREEKRMREKNAGMHGDKRGRKSDEKRFDEAWDERMAAMRRAARLRDLSSLTFEGHLGGWMLPFVSSMQWTSKLPRRR